MKKYLSSVLAIVMIAIYFPVFVLADEVDNDTIYYDNGCYLTIEIQQIDTRTSERVSGNKIYTYKSASGTVLWKATLNGTFLYTGSNATCTSSNCEVTIYNSSWYVVSKSTGMLSATATAELTMGQKLLGVTVEKKTINMKLTCDANGNLS